MAIKTIIVLLVALALASVHLAHAQQPGKLPRIGYLVPGPLPRADPASTPSAKVFTILAMWRERTLSLSTDMRKDGTIAYVTLRLTSSALGSTSS